jgi:hypothetical protein
MKTLADYQKEYKETIEQMKVEFKCNFVFNYDQLALCSQFTKQGLDFHKFECSKQNKDIRVFEKISVLCIGFKFYHKFRNEQYPYLTGYNVCSLAACCDGNEYFDKGFNLILPLEGTDQETRIRDNYEASKQEEIEWKVFKEIDLNNKKLGESFEIGESIYWHFLECLPPIYGKGCFYCSEPVRHTSKGEKVYYKLSKVNNKHLIELNTVSK